MYASLILGRVKDELRLSVFLKHGVIMIYSHRAIGVPVGGRPNFENAIIHAVCEGCRANYSKDSCNKQPTQSHP
jgi:hypothetical protein